MSLPVPGSDCVLRILEGGETPAFRMVEGLKLTSWKVRNDTVEVTDAGDQGWRRLLAGAGVRSLDLALSGLYLGSPGEVLLRQSALQGSMFEAELMLGSSLTLRGGFVASEFGCESAGKDETSFTAKLCSAGPLSVA